MKLHPDPERFHPAALGASTKSGATLRDRAEVLN